MGAEKISKGNKILIANHIALKNRNKMVRSENLLLKKIEIHFCKICGV